MNPNVLDCPQVEFSITTELVAEVCGFAEQSVETVRMKCGNPQSCDSGFVVRNQITPGAS